MDRPKIAEAREKPDQAETEELLMDIRDEIWRMQNNLSTAQATAQELPTDIL